MERKRDVGRRDPHPKHPTHHTPTPVLYEKETEREKGVGEKETEREESKKAGRRRRISIIPVDCPPTQSGRMEREGEAGPKKSKPARNRICSLRTVILTWTGRKVGCHGQTEIKKQTNEESERGRLWVEMKSWRETEA